MAEPKIQFLFFDGCPLAAAAKQALEDAIVSLNLTYEVIDILDPDTPDDLRNWASPTILINGRDVAGGKQGSGLGCRVYPGPSKVPDARAIIDCIRRETVRHSIPIVKVSDIEAAENFYCSVLGFEKRGEYFAAPDGPAYMTVAHGGAILHLSSFPGDGTYGTAIYFDVDDVDSLYESFRKSGLEKADLEPTDQSWNRREIYVLDPDGNCLRFGSPLQSP